MSEGIQIRDKMVFLPYRVHYLKFEKVKKKLEKNFKKLLLSYQKLFGL